ncbi:MAG: DUF924 domain-containing protein [Gammaproteobacteria bacterium]|nr:DUF924 domain-containing protein [Gammaproteobacteria bacterium]
MHYQDVISYWFSEKSQKHWFNSTPEIDAAIKAKFEGLWEMAAAGELDFWCETPEGSLALIIVLDQFPLNMFRGEAKSFQTEHRAVEVALKSIDNGVDKLLSDEELHFLLMPLMHSEELKEQELSVKLFKAYNLIDGLSFAEHHRDLIKEFGRFPHRNEILSRKSMPEEIEYLASKRAFIG